MPRVVTILVVAGFALTSADAHAQQSAADSIVAACLERDTTTAWQRMSAEWSDERRGWSNDSLRQVLIAMAAADQAVRTVTGFADSIKSPAFLRRMAEQDSVDRLRLLEIVRRFGWPTKSMVGAKGASAAFLIAQHNESMQPEALRLMMALPPDEVQRSELAMLEDRVLVVSGRPQKYGTQLQPPSGNRVELYPIDSLLRVDARRTAVGLPPMDVYRCMMRGFTGLPVVMAGSPVIGPPMRYWSLRDWMYLRFSGPLAASAEFTRMVVPPLPFDYTELGAVFTVEAGWRGAEARVGVARLNAFNFGISAAASVMRYWGSGAWSQPSRTYLGGELHASAMIVDVGWGLYQAVGHATTRFAWTVGVTW